MGLDMATRQRPNDGGDDGGQGEGEHKPPARLRPAAAPPARPSGLGRARVLIVGWTCGAGRLRVREDHPEDLLVKRNRVWDEVNSAQRLILARRFDNELRIAERAA